MRRILAALLIPLAIALPAVAAWSTWAHAQATDTGSFARASRSLADDAAVQRAVADRLVALADARLAGARLPADPATVHARVRSIVDQLVASAPYRAALRAAVRTTHARLAARLTGGADTPVRLELDRLAAILRARLTAAGLAPIAAEITAPEPILIADRADVRRAQQGFEAVRIVRAIALPGAVLALLGVMATARRRGSGLLRAALCLVASIALGAAAWPIVRDALHDDVAVAVFDVLSRPLRWWAIGAAGLAAALAAAAAIPAAARHHAARAARHPWPLPRP